MRKIDAPPRSRVPDPCKTIPMGHIPEQSALATATSAETLA
ncbi:hypothetical protein [Laspinema olomoucense]|nr:hypothetical protein [Laspinema sp. D3b]